MYDYTPVLFNWYKEIKQNLDWNHLMVFFKVLILVLNYIQNLHKFVSQVLQNSQVNQHFFCEACVPSAAGVNILPRNP